MAGVLVLGACATNAEKQGEQDKKDKLIDTNISLGIEYMQRGKLEYAKEKFEKALEIDSSNPEANNAMALLLWRFKDFDKAEYHFNRAVSADEQNAEAQNNFGVFLCERGKFNTAVKHFNKALENPLYKTPAQANLNAGLCLIKGGNKIEAEKYFRAALEMDPKLPVALYHMGKLSFETGNTLSARAFMERFFSISQDTAESLYLAYKVEKTLGDRNAAASYRIRLKGKFPDSPEAKRLASNK